MARRDDGAEGAIMLLVGLAMLAFAALGSLYGVTPRRYWPYLTAILIGAGGGLYYVSQEHEAAKATPAAVEVSKPASSGKATVVYDGYGAPQHPFPTAVPPPLPAQTPGTPYPTGGSPVVIAPAATCTAAYVTPGCKWPTPPAPSPAKREAVAAAYARCMVTDIFPNAPPSAKQNYCHAIAENNVDVGIETPPPVQPVAANHKGTWCDDPIQPARKQLEVCKPPLSMR
jgi:hypothetical protein